MDKRYEIINENYKRILFDIEDTCIKIGRNPKDITFLAATKTVKPEYINHAISLGVKAIGENRVQELCEKYNNINTNNCDVQFIGNLQTNKIKSLVGKVSTIQSICTISQIEELSKRLKRENAKIKVLIEVNIGSEYSKGGVNPNHLWEFIHEASEYKEIQIDGIMAIPPICENKIDVNEHFSQMHKYFIDIKTKKKDNVFMNTLSMGMSDDYKEAVACGSTMVRIGSGLFGDRIYS